MEIVSGRFWCILSQKSWDAGCNSLAENPFRGDVPLTRSRRYLDRDGQDLPRVGFLGPITDDAI
jgi:hypothetical protein